MIATPPELVAESHLPPPVMKATPLEPGLRSLSLDAARKEISSPPAGDAAPADSSKEG
jgi:hypothetical protein